MGNIKASKLLTLKLAEYLSREDPDLDPNINYVGRKGIQFGAYVFIHPKTNYMYVGSTDNLYERRYKHFWHIKNNSHRNHRVREHYAQHPVDKFIFLSWETQTREQAFDIEQSFLDEYKDSPKILNIAFNARLAGLGAERSQELRERIRNRVKKTTSDPAYRKLKSDQAKKQFSTPEAKAALRLRIKKALNREDRKERARTVSLKQWSMPGARKKFLDAIKARHAANGRKVSINGTIYPHTAEASRTLLISPSGLKFRLKSQSPKWNNYFYL